MLTMLAAMASLPEQPNVRQTCPGSEWRRWAFHAANATDKLITHRATTSGRAHEANPAMRAAFGKRIDPLEALASFAFGAAVYEFGHARAETCEDLRRHQTIALGIQGSLAIYMTVRFGF